MPPYVGKVMKNNVFKFRRLKWGDPREKFKLLPEGTAPRMARRDAPGLGRLDILLIVMAVVSVLIAGAALVG